MKFQTSCKDCVFLDNGCILGKETYEKDGTIAFDGCCSSRIFKRARVNSHKCTVLIWSDGDLGKIQQTVSSVKGHRFFHKIIICLYQQDMTVMHKVKSFFLDQSINWSIEHYCDSDIHLKPQCLIDYYAQKVKSRWLLSLSQGDAVKSPASFTKIIHDDFALVYDKDRVFVDMDVFRNFDGNEQELFTSKLKSFDSEGKLCKTMKKELLSLHPCSIMESISKNIFQALLDKS